MSYLKIVKLILIAGQSQYYIYAGFAIYLSRFSAVIKCSL